MVNQKEQRAECRRRNLVYDTKLKKCRPSKRKVSGKTIKEIREECKAKGLVYDRETRKCRAPKKRRAKKEQYTLSQLRAECRRRKLVYDTKLKKCRPSKRGKTIKEIREECKAKGLVYDRETGKCRAPKKRGTKKLVVKKVSKIPGFKARLTPVKFKKLQAIYKQLTPANISYGICRAQREEEYDPEYPYYMKKPKKFDSQDIQNLLRSLKDEEEYDPEYPYYQK